MVLQARRRRRGLPIDVQIVKCFTLCTRISVVSVAHSTHPCPLRPPAHASFVIFQDGGQRAARPQAGLAVPVCRATVRDQLSVRGGADNSRLPNEGGDI